MSLFVLRSVEPHDLNIYGIQFYQNLEKSVNIQSTALYNLNEKVCYKIKKMLKLLKSEQFTWPLYSFVIVTIFLSFNNLYFPSFPDGEGSNKYAYIDDIVDDFKAAKRYLHNYVTQVLTNISVYRIINSNLNVFL